MKQDKKSSKPEPKMVRVHDMRDYAREVGAHGAEMYNPKEMPVSPLPKVLKK